MAPRITIVTPSYNQGALLEPTIRSVVDQRYPRLEYVIIDAGSTDGSLSILESYSSAVARWVSEPDAGHADGINKGFVGTCGDIMGWINASDIYYPWTLATVAEVFSDVPEAQWIVGMPSHVAETGDPKSVSNMTWNLYDFLSPDTRWLQQESVFWRRNLWEAAGGRLDVNLRYACDFELWTRFVELSPLYHVNLPLAGFRVHDAQRGAAGRENYETEAEAVRAAFRKKVGQRECRRAGLALTMRSTLGATARKALKRARLLQWHAYPLIKYDFVARHWFAVWE